MIAWLLVPLRRVAMRSAYRLNTRFRRLFRIRTNGVRVIAVTAAGEIILVHHSYLAGWHLPGGGVDRGETPEDAALRELREEIGMTRHGAVRELGIARFGPAHAPSSLTLFLAEDVAFAPHWSLEIEEARAFAPHALPDTMTAGTRLRIEEWQAGRAMAARW